MCEIMKEQQKEKNTEENYIMPVDYKEYLELTHDENYIDLYKYYSKETIFDIVGVSRQENPHSSFIRWMLGSGKAYGLGDLPFRKFIETVLLIKEKYYDSQNANDGRWQDPANIFNSENYLAKCNTNFLEALRYGRYIITSFDIANEVVLDKSRRADIFAIATIILQDTEVEFNLLIIIENKVHSKEHDNQTERYVDDLGFDGEPFKKAMNKMLGDRGKLVGKENCLKLFVYLNPSNNRDIKAAILNHAKGVKEGLLPVSMDYLSLTYQNILDGVIEPLYGLADDEFKSRLLEYIRCLGQAKTSCIEDNKGNVNDEGDYLIMAISKNEKDKVISLFLDYGDLILEILSGVGSDEFILGNAESDFWTALANAYRLLIKPMSILDDSQEWNDKIEQLRQIVESSNKVKKKYCFNGCEYESKPKKNSGKKNLGMLCRDIIADYATEQGDKDHDKLIELREKIKEKIKHNWLKEGILFNKDIEVLESNPDFWKKGYDNNEKDKNNLKRTTCFEGFENSFFSLWEKDKDNQKKIGNRYDINLDEASNRGDCLYDLEIKLSDGAKAYVAKYWSDYALWLLVDILKELGGKDYKKLIKC